MFLRAFGKEEETDIEYRCVYSEQKNLKFGFCDETKTWA